MPPTAATVGRSRLSSLHVQPSVVTRAGGGEGEGGGGDRGGSGGSGGSGDNGGSGGSGDNEHTRQPVEVELMSEDHWIVPGPKMKLEGPTPPEKLVGVPDGWVGMRRKS